MDLFIITIEGSIRPIKNSPLPWFRAQPCFQAEREAAEKAAFQAELDRAVREDEKRKQRSRRFVVVVV